MLHFPTRNISRRVLGRVEEMEVLVVPSCSKAEGPFMCLECAGALVRKQGKIRVFHFAHHLLSPDGSGGGESAIYKEKVAS